MNLRLFDAHCDTAFELWHNEASLRENELHVDLEKSAVFSNYAQVFAFCAYAGCEFVPGITSMTEYLTKPFKRFRAELAAHADKIEAVTSIDAVASVHDRGKIAALFSIEGAETVDCDPNALPELAAQGFAMTTLTWNADNALAGWHGSQRGLTAQGADFVREAQRAGIAIDVSHLSESAFWDLIRITNKPILASHSNCRALCEHTRNLSDEQLRAIRDTDGVVGLNLYLPFLGENADFDTVRRHLEHLLLLCGEKNVVFGGDLDGCDRLPTGFRDVSSYSALYNYLRGAGYDEVLLDRIFYLNLFDFLKREVH